MTVDQLDAWVEGCAAAHQRLLAHLDSLVESGVEAGGEAGLERRPSALPGWTVGHVLTHLARNADSHIRLLEGAARGESVHRYPGGPVQRNGEIEAGAGRPFAEQVVDVRRTIWALEGCWARLEGSAWLVVGQAIAGAEPAWMMPWKRWREVEIHHSDLGLPGFGSDDWSREYVRRELTNAVMAWRASRPMGLTDLPPAALALPPARRLAWLVGRPAVDGLPAVPQWF